MQVLAEMGFPGLIVWLSLLGYSGWAGLKVRSRASRGDPSSGEAYFDFTMANAFLASMSAFVIGGSFIALALNDLTWLTFALFASMERLSRTGAAAPALARPIIGSNLGLNGVATHWTSAAHPSR